ncbi:M16 family metallopeptidase [Inmirania thermothiophila]|uniref:Zinc protease n=1 Tax=Inmirania thermothiophila TaxID=1750597 RepID=A0A3N1Y6U3_9GAMM|nr:pitrilysin family protein [Inmirania thermothiophila]ROR34238.1 zinc protease [Inmirania thermothiophila]
MHRRGWAWLLAAFAPWALAGGVAEYRLDNGLKLLVKEDHRAPVVVSQVWYRVGSSYEHDGITGISHLLEHMMFKGTPAHPAGEFSRIIAELGGRENAFTGQDYTAYFQTLARDRLEVAFALEADRMRNLLLPEEELRKEAQVVMEERRLRTEDDPQAFTYERFKATAFLSGPQRIPVIGWMDDLRHVTRDDLLTWYRRFYAPSNATLVVVGDVEPEAVRALAERHFGPVPPAPPPAVKPRPEIPQTGPRRITVRRPARVPLLLMGYKVPALAQAEPRWEAYALEVLAGILDGGASARLARELVRGREIAASAGAGYSLYDRLPTLLVLEATPAPGHDVAELEAALRAQVRRLREEPVSDEELARVKAQVVAAAVYQRDSVFYQAMQLGIAETVGLGWRAVDEYVPAVRAVTAAQVQAVARRYLTDEGLTVAVLEPQGGAGDGR